MEKKKLLFYLEKIRNLYNLKKYAKALAVCERTAEKISTLESEPFEKYEFYFRFGDLYYFSWNFSRALEMFHKVQNFVLTKQVDKTFLNSAEYMLGRCHCALKNYDQALLLFINLDRYFRENSGSLGLENTRRQQFVINTYIGMIFCYMSKNDTVNAGEVFENRIKPLLPHITDELSIINYNHIKGEYLITLGDIASAVEFFKKCIELSGRIQFSTGIIEANIHIAVIALIKGEINETIRIMKKQLAAAKKHKLNILICECSLFLSHCYSLQGAVSKAQSIERKIKPFMVKLDILWLYEKKLEFEKIFQKLHVNAADKRENLYAPHVLTTAIDRHYKELPPKNSFAGNSAAVNKVWHLIEKVAPTEITVLIQGETGTGKELVARAIHQLSLRAEKIWLPFNSGALAEALLENELFGHTKGSFTGAVEDKKGYIEIAANGTLFIDEISDMPMKMQQKLLRVLEEKQLLKIGAQKLLPVSTRFVFASNRDVEELVEKGLFRKDLYYRINAVIINLPPLRDRTEDLPALVEHFLKKHLPSGRNVRFSDSALTALANYDWPGNIRELETEIKRICIFHENDEIVEPYMLSDAIRSSRFSVKIPQETNLTLKGLRNTFERNVIAEILKKNMNNISVTAKQLGLGRTGFYKKMKQLNIKIK